MNTVATVVRSLSTRATRSDPLRIGVVSAVGTGPTELAAFDAALVRAGAANFNLLRLSSVIPPASSVEIVDRALEVEGDWGDRLYVVMAEQRTSVPGDSVAAGIGWVQNERAGHGLFVEHEGCDVRVVEQDIDASLGALVAARGGSFGPVQRKTVAATCGSEPVCALVIAVYGAEPWTSRAEIDLR